MHHAKSTTAVNNFEFLFPDVEDFGGNDQNVKELIFWFTPPPLTSSSMHQTEKSIDVGSNCYYETWLFNNKDSDWRKCVGIGGSRCCYGESYYDTWHCPEGHHLKFRLHWINPHVGLKLFGYDANVLYRSVFDQSFIAVRGDQTELSSWRCEIESMGFGVKMSTQLARQNIKTANRFSPIAIRKLNHLQDEWKIIPLPVKQQILKEIPLKEVTTTQHTTTQRTTTATTTTPSTTTTTTTPSKGRGRGRGQRNQRIGDHSRGPTQRQQPQQPQQQPQQPQRYQSNRPTRFPNKGEDIVTVAHSACGGWGRVTYDLGGIALYRFEVNIPDSSSGQAVILCYSELPSYSSAWSTANRKKVRLADAFSCSGSIIGFRGCRYLHVLTCKSESPFTIRAYRSEYPFSWKSTDGEGDVDKDRETLLGACRANLIACVDGNVVDTCWRERVLWVGDLRMAAKAIRRLTNNPEVTEFCLHLISDSYDPKIGMVQGAWPTGSPSFRLVMPTYHLAFCLTALEHDPSLRFDDRVKNAVLDSISVWKERYIKHGLLTELPGWSFVDWSPADPSVAARDQSLKPKNPRNSKSNQQQEPETPKGSHMICNLWWMEVCRQLGVESGIDEEKFRATFKTRDGWRLFGSGNSGNVHATMAALASPCITEEKEGSGHGLALLRSNIQSGWVKQNMTAYYAYFVAAALKRHSTNEDEAVEFIKEYYGPIASRFGTIYEKTSDQASMAHSWSVGFCEFL